MTELVPTLDVELALALRCGTDRCIVVGLDEVGRGALAGPVAVGACAIEVVDGRIAALPEGVRDSKQLSAVRRRELVQPILDTARAGSVGWAAASEIDEVGIMAALSRAAVRALQGLGVQPDAILLDGNVDVLGEALTPVDGLPPLLELRVGADRDCASTAAASILAKVARDDHMVELDALAPRYRWAANKGYGSAAHREAIALSGLHLQHRRSWRLAGGPAPAGAGVLWEEDIRPERQEERS